MKKTALFTLLAGGVCAAALLSLRVLVPGRGGSASQADAAGARELLDQEGRLLSRGDLSGLYALMTPRYRALCTYEQFARGDLGNPIAGLVNGTTVSYDQVQIDISGKEARLAYVMTSNGKEVMSVPQRYPDIYQHVGGRWRDDRRGDAGCFAFGIST